MVAAAVAASTSAHFIAERPLRARRRAAPPFPCSLPLSSSAAQTEPIQRLQRLPPITFSYGTRELDAAELSSLLQQVSCFAPGQSFHCPPASSSSGISSVGGSSSLRPAAYIDPQRLQGALQRSLVCVAAFTAEKHLPPHQHLGSRGLLSLEEAAAAAAEDVAAAVSNGSSNKSRGGSSSSSSSSSAASPWLLLPGMPWKQQQQQQRRRVLVGFARAVGDATLVATMHDVAVMPELQQLGLGRQLVQRVVQQLDRMGIIDVGLLAPESSQEFFTACSFGRDSEGSTTMMLGEAGVQQRVGLPLEGMSVHLKQRQRQAQAQA